MVHVFSVLSGPLLSRVLSIQMGSLISRKAGKGQGQKANDLLTEYFSVMTVLGFVPKGICGFEF